MSDYAPPEFDPEDYDAVEKIAAVAAPIFELHDWQWSRSAGVPSEAAIADTIRNLYARHADEPLLSVGSGRLVLVDDNTHDGVPTLHEGVRVFLDLGELPPLHGDALDDGTTP